METGTRVRLKADPGKVGIITGKSRELGDRIHWQVSFPDSMDYHREEHLEVISGETDDPINLLQKGKLGRARDLRGNLTNIRLNGRLANLIYSMDTTNTDFYAYQFKPVLNFIDSPNSGLLIADEVGLGKTIEAGLILTELRSRFDIRKVLVVCTAMLRSKWKDELRKRFGISSEMAKPKDLLDTFREIKAGERIDYTFISGMQGLRPRKEWEDEKKRKDHASLLARFMEENQDEEPLIDLLIIDEAHYMRNPESMTSQLGRLLKGISANILLLSATPIHLRNQDLYRLLNLVDEDTFNQPSVFDEILRANEPIMKATDAVLNNRISKVSLFELLHQARQHPYLEDNRQLRALLDEFAEKTDLTTPEGRAVLLSKLHGINLLGKVVNRTRKREVKEWRVVREPVAEVIPLTDIERDFYNKVTALVRQYAKKRGIHEGFLLVTPQRQISSSMPAAIRQWQKSNRADLASQLYEDTGYEYDKELGPLTQEIVSEAHTFGRYEDLFKNDSKYFRLRDMLKRYFKENPKEKVILFAYFRPTLYYLQERLTKDGILSVVLTGKESKDKDEIIGNFQKDSRYSVLLSSEVASEGIDLQFSRLLVNYDLPWNPMRVEQRIGRLDRIGQESPKITIWNLFYEDTIDQRIHDRLYMRLDIFRRALGDLEGIIGEEIRKLTTALLFADLTPEQESARITQTEQAISNIRNQEEHLEEEASNLVAHSDYILDKVRAARELQRCITDDDLWNYVYDFFLGNYRGSEFLQLRPEELIFDIKLSDQARYDLDKFLNEKFLSGQTRLASAHQGKVKCHFKNKVQGGTTKAIENINQFHPLVRFVGHRMRQMASPYYSPNSVELDRQNIPDVAPAVYVFVVKLWSVRGIRHIERLFMVVKRLGASNGLLSDDVAEKLVTTASRQGRDWLSAKNDIDLDAAKEDMVHCQLRCENHFDEFAKSIRHENNDRADIQERTLREHMENQINKYHGVLQKHLFLRRESLAKATQGKIDKLRNILEFKLKEISERRNIQPLQQEICIGLIKVI